MCWHEIAFELTIAVVRAVMIVFVWVVIYCFSGILSLPTTRPTNGAYTLTYPSHALPDIRRQGQAACVTEQSYHAFVLHPHLIAERLRKPKDKDKHAMSAFACFGRNKGSSEERKVFAVTRRPVRRVLGCREIRAGCDWLEGLRCRAG